VWLARFVRLAQSVTDAIVGCKRLLYSTQKRVSSPIPRFQLTPL